MSSFFQTPDTLHDGELTIAVISPDRQRRSAASAAFARCKNVEAREFTDYPPSVDDALHLLDHGFDIIVIDLDGNPEYALQLVESLYTVASAVVMVFSAHAESELLLRSMRAGARDFFTLPFAPDTVADAMRWVAARRKPRLTAEKTDGRLLIFFGSKGGVGVTTLSSNFAVALAEESGQSTLLIDLNLNLGDAALNLGIRSKYSVVDALQDSAGTSATLHPKFLVQHSSGLYVLPAPAELARSVETSPGVGNLMAVARQQFHYVVVDAGKKIDLKHMNLFEPTAIAYLVTEIGIPDLRNANRLVSQFSQDRSPALEIVINRYRPHFLGFTDEHLVKALSRPPRWKIPNDFDAARQLQGTPTLIVDQDVPIARAIRQMARSVCGRDDSLPIASSHSSSKGRFRLHWKDEAKHRTHEPAQTAHGCL